MIWPDGRISRFFAQLVQVLFLVWWIGAATSCGRDAPVAFFSKNLELLIVFDIPIPEPSGLVYSEARNSLFVISDSRSAIYQIDTTGRVLKAIPISATDLEGVALSRREDTLYVVEEAAYRVTSYLSDGTKARSFVHVTGTDPSHGLEGIAIDTSYHIYLLNEKPPLLVKLTQNGAELWRKTLTATTDVSDICYNARENCLWVVSDESKKLLKLSVNGDLIEAWDIPVVKAEGVAVHGNTMFICSDQTAKLYLFRKPASN